MSVDTIRRRAGSTLAGHAPTGWAQGAACVGADLDLFFGPDHELSWQREKRERAALAICRRCPVAAWCLDTALAQSTTQWGVQGGMTAEERKSERRRRQRSTTPKPKPKPKPKKPAVLRVDATGSRRRIQASSAAGRRMKLYAQLSGVSSSFLSKLRSGQIDVIRADTAKKIAAAYPHVLARLDDVSPEPLGAAALAGWPGADAWVGVDIDDPDARPRTAQTTAA